MRALDLTPAEEAHVREVLEIAISDLGMEIAGTDSLDFRDRLKERREALRKLVDALGPESVGRETRPELDV